MMIPEYEWTKPEVEALKAAWATDTGKLALMVIIERLGLIHGGPPSLDPLTLAFTEGRRWMARELKAVVNKPIDKLVKEQHEPRDSRPISSTKRAEQLAADRASGIAGAAARAGKRTPRT